MERLLFWLCLSGAVAFAPTVLNSPGGGFDSIMIAGSNAIIPPVSSAETIAPRSEQEGVHSVVVEMPQEISLRYAEPKTWGDLPVLLRPYEQPAATPVMQFAVNLAR
jgi:hypothetical protein